MAALRLAVKSLMDPTRQDLVAAVSETLLSEPSLNRMRQRMLQSTSGRSVLRLRPIVNSQTVDIPSLQQLPNNTFGYAYSQFLKSEQVSPDTRVPVEHFRGDQELAYLILRYRQIHDYMHTVLNLPTSLKGELALKWFEFIQTGMPMTLAAAVFGPLRLTQVWKFQDPRPSGQDATNFASSYVPWAIKAGANADFMLAVEWERHFAMDLQELRSKLNIIPFTLQ